MYRPLRIAVPIHSLEPGGVERVALGLAIEWQRTGHHVTVVLGRTGSANLCSAPALDYWRIPTRLSTAQWETPWMVHCLYSYLLRNRTDVLFCPGNTYAIVAAAMKVLLDRHAPPMVLKVSNALERPDMPPLLRRGYGAWLRLQGAIFDRLVGLSEPMQREICTVTKAAAANVPIIANPVISRRTLTRLANLRPSSDSVWSTRYLAIGRLAPQKNFAMLLRAFARSARPHDRLTVAGDGSQRSALEQLAVNLGIAGQVRFLGHQPSVEPFLAEADVFVLSSDYEGLPGVVVEALAAGLPVLATDCCVSMSRLIDSGRTGMLVPPGDEATFANCLVAMRSFRTDPERARSVAATYELEDAAARYVEMMTELHGSHLDDANRRRNLDLISPSISRGQMN
jgi:Glycosyltransferase